MQNYELEKGSNVKEGLPLRKLFMLCYVEIKIKEIADGGWINACMINR